jgi:hypothetical protein
MDGFNASQNHASENHDPRPAAGTPRRGTSRPRGEAGSDWLPGGHLPLVESDRLTFHILQAVPGRPPRPGLAEAFRDGYAGVWDRVPAEARDLLLADWATPEWGWAGGGPLVQVREASPPPHVAEFGPFGREQSFPAALVRRPAALRAAVAWGLALAYRALDRSHYRQALELLEGPMEAWESGSGAGATEEEADAMWADLQATFLREQRAAVVALLDRWGLGDTLADGVERGTEKV